jgi:hypothetical protein
MLESARLRKLTIDSRRSTPTKSFQHPRRRWRMSHYRSQRHVCAAIGARSAVHPKAVPQQLCPQGVSTSGCVCGASPQRFERLEFGGFGHNRRVKWGIPWGARAPDVIVMAE